MADWIIPYTKMLYKITVTIDFVSAFLFGRQYVSLSVSKRYQGPVSWRPTTVK